MIFTAFTMSFLELIFAACSINFSGKNTKILSSDNDPLFVFHRWQANLRILDIEEIKSVPYTPTSPPYVKRLIGTVRLRFLDKIFFGNDRDLQNKLDSFK